jgi:hypothetical protein
MKRAALALLFACSTANAADCVALADGLSASADAGRRGVDVSVILSAANDESRDEVTNVNVRLLLLEAFRRGASGESMDEVWMDFYMRCKSASANNGERPS